MTKIKMMKMEIARPTPPVPVGLLAKVWGRPPPPSTTRQSADQRLDTRTAQGMET